MKCSEFAKRIMDHAQQYGDGEIYMSVDREAPGLTREGVDALAIDQRSDFTGISGVCDCDCEACVDCEEIF